MANANANKPPRGNRAAQQGAKAPAAPDEQRSAPPSGSNAPDLAGGTGPIAGQQLLPPPDQPGEPSSLAGQPSASAQAPVGGTALAGSASERGDSGDDVEGLWIRSVPESLRRAGRRFTQEGAGFALDLFTAEELEQLESEPNLVVEHVTFSNEGVVSR